MNENAIYIFVFERLKFNFKKYTAFDGAQILDLLITSLGFSKIVATDWLPTSASLNSSDLVSQMEKPLSSGVMIAGLNAARSSTFFN